MSDARNADHYDEPTLSEDEREAFRWRIEALANGALRIQRMAARDDAHEFIQRNRIDLCRQAAKLVGDVCGDWIKLTANDGASLLEYVARSLAIWRPALALRDESDNTWIKVIDEIQRLPYGDEPEIFRPAPRARGEHQKPAKLALRRLEALKWHEFLKSRGIRPTRCKLEIALAFGADWEAIRKWRVSVGRQFGPAFVGWELAYARDGYEMSFAFPEYHAALQSDGANYRELMGLQALDADAVRKAFVGKPNG